MNQTKTLLDDCAFGIIAAMCTTADGGAMLSSTQKCYLQVMANTAYEIAECMMIKRSNLNKELK